MADEARSDQDPFLVEEQGERLQRVAEHIQADLKVHERRYVDR